MPLQNHPPAQSPQHPIFVLRIRGGGGGVEPEFLRGLNPSIKIPVGSSPRGGRVQQDVL